MLTYFPKEITNPNHGIITNESMPPPTGIIPPKSKEKLFQILLPPKLSNPTVSSPVLIK